uniref:Apple domain-containing protein n=1 Tax=Acrobeloides nanus TaxID=290746 RepID=A0A914D0E4_9BILA
MKFRARSFLISLLFWQLQLFTVCRAEEASKFAHDLFPLGRPIKKPFHISSYARDGVGKFKHEKEDIQGNDTTAERLGFSYKVPEEETQRDHVIPYGHPTKKSRDHSHYGSSANSYAYSASRHEVDAIGHKDTTNNFISENDAHQVIAGIPDLSDPCFRRYANTIIVNAQPYERRSSISLINCKRRCLESQIGVYSCRSFVYDNINQ